MSNDQEKKKILTTGALREVMAQAILEVRSGALGLEEASAMLKLGRNVTDSLFSETKIAIMRREIGDPTIAFGSLPIGETTSNEAK